MARFCYNSSYLSVSSSCRFTYTMTIKVGTPFTVIIIKKDSIHQNDDYDALNEILFISGRKRAGALMSSNKPFQAGSQSSFFNKNGIEAASLEKLFWHLLMGTKELTDNSLTKIMLTPNFIYSVYKRKVRPSSYVLYFCPILFQYGF